MITEDFEAVKIDDDDLLTVKEFKVMTRVTSFMSALTTGPVSNAMMIQLVGDDKYTELTQLAIARAMVGEDLTSIHTSVIHFLKWSDREPEKDIERIFQWLQSKRTS